MDPWIENYIEKLESKKSAITPSDFRFYNIGRLPLLADRTKAYASGCRECKSNIRVIEHLADRLPECLNTPEERKSFEKERHAVERHLRKVHKVLPAHYYYALYAFLGAIIGIILGIVISLLLLNTINLNVPLIFFALGLFSGQIIGKKADKKAYTRNTQI